VTAEEATRLLERPSRAWRPPSGVPTGSLALDSALSTRGWPRGRVSRVWGDPDTGKTTLVLLSVARAQELGMACALLDLAASFDPGYAARLGVDLDELLVTRQPVPCLPADFVVTDGAGLVPTLPGTTVVMVTPAVCAASVSVLLRAAHRNQPGDITVAATVTRDDFDHDFGLAQRPQVTWRVPRSGGIDHAAELLAMSLSQGLLGKNGAWYYLGDRLLGHGARQSAATLWNLANDG
jgi:hypothetical protein